VAVLHGGPGAPGSAAAVARELARDMGVLEPLQTRDSVEGQIEELRLTIDAHGDPPVTLVGHSWGAMLGVLFAARHPNSVAKLILVGSGPMESHYAEGIMPTRLSRIPEADRGEARRLMDRLSSGDFQQSELDRLGVLMGCTDTYESLPEADNGSLPPADDGAVDLSFQPRVHERVWAEAAKLRSEGGFVRAVRAVRCPVAAIHGDYDPHPAEGVKEPFAAHAPGFRFHLLSQCGHEPWRERHAHAEFFRVLRDELSVA
jgi:pimeloyl-ACP methyl ester carboxylesterase